MKKSTKRKATATTATTIIGKLKRAEPVDVVRVSWTKETLGGKPATWPIVICDMAERHRIGTAKYGKPLVPHNGRDTLRDAYEEALDLAVYLRTAIYERDGK